MYSKSERLFEEAIKYIPGGVNSPVRFYKPFPIFVKEAKGSRIIDEDDNEYIDYVMGYGALLFGHSPNWLVEEISYRIKKGVLYGMPTALEIDLARKIKEMVPNAELVRLVNSGLEATMHAIRLARAYTRREYIVKFRGCYHGSHDYNLVNMGEEFFGIPSSPGNLEEIASKTLVAEYNDLEKFEKIMKKYGEKVAGVIIEPVAANMGLVDPDPDFIKGVREITEEYNSLLIFDEVVTGFRIAKGGAQEYFKINADLITLGKALGSGLPIAAYCGKKEIMELVAPQGPFYQAGTYSGNPISVTAAIATLKMIEREGERIYSKLRSYASVLEEEITSIKSRVKVNRFEGLIQIFFNDKKVRNYSDASSSNTSKYMKFHSLMVSKGIFIPPSQLETWFPSFVHSEEDLEKTIEAIRYSLREIGDG